MVNRPNFDRRAMLWISSHALLNFRSFRLGFPCFDLIKAHGAAPRESVVGIVIALSVATPRSTPENTSWALRRLTKPLPLTLRLR